VGDSTNKLVVMIYGDANEDCMVDGADYTIWADHYTWTGQAPWPQGGWTVGNFNEDDTVDGADYTRWADKYGWDGGGGDGGKGEQSQDADAQALVDELDWEDEPTVTYSVVELGDGLYGYTFTLHGNDATYGSFFADVTFEAEEGCIIRQQKVIFGQRQWDVHCEYYAEAFDGMGDPPYDMDRDSWFGDAFGHSPPAAIQDLEQTETTYHIESGTGGASEHLDVKLAYIVSDGAVTLTGLIARLGVNYEVEVEGTPGE
jgi:hypothetical protein